MYFCVFLSRVIPSRYLQQAHRKPCGRPMLCGARGIPAVVEPEAFPRSKNIANSHRFQNIVLAHGLQRFFLVKDRGCRRLAECYLASAVSIFIFGFFFAIFPFAFPFLAECYLSSVVSIFATINPGKCGQILNVSLCGEISYILV